MDLRMQMEMELLRKDIAKAASAHSSLSDPEIVALSHQLDLLLNRYYKSLYSPLKAATDPS